MKTLKEIKAIIDNAPNGVDTIKLNEELFIWFEKDEPLKGETSCEICVELHYHSNVDSHDTYFETLNYTFFTSEKEQQDFEELVQEALLFVEEEE